MSITEHVTQEVKRIAIEGKAINEGIANIV